MAHDSSDPRPPGEPAFVREAGAKAARKLRAQRQGPPDVWSGLGLCGLVGWSVAAPTLAGALLGLWLDRRYPGTHSWTLMLLVAGLVAGCAHAANWVRRENKAMDHQTGRDDE